MTIGSTTNSLVATLRIRKKVMNEAPMMPVPTHLYLNEIPSGAHAVVHRIEAADEAMHRLMAMGLCVGRELEVVRQGNPLILRILGARIGVSSRLARHVVVTLS